MAEKNRPLKIISLAVLIVLLLLLLLFTQCSDTADNTTSSDPVSAGTEQVSTSGSYISQQQTGTVFAQLSRTGERYTSDLTWQVYKPDAQGEAGGPEIVKFIGNPFALYLKPGKYVVKSSLSKAANGQVLIEIKDGQPANFVVSLKAGFVVLSGKISETSAPITRDITWSVRRYVDGDLVTVASAITENQKFLLDEGRYRLAAKFGNTDHLQDFTIEENTTVEITPNFNSGVLMLNGVLSDTSPPIARDIRWGVYKLNDDGTAEKTSGGAAIDERARMILSANRYRLVARYGAAEVIQPVTVQAGKESSQTINFKAGILNVSGVSAENSAEITKDIVWSVYALNETGTARRPSIASAINETASFILPAGKYSIVASLYHDGKITGSGEIVITEGKTHTLTPTFSRTQ